MVARDACQLSGSHGMLRLPPPPATHLADLVPLALPARHPSGPNVYPERLVHLRPLTRSLRQPHCAEGPGRAGLGAGLRGRPGGRRRLTQSWSFGASSGSISLLKRMAVCWSANMRSPQLELSLILWEKNSSSFQRSARSSVRVMSSMTERRRIEKPPLPPNGAAG